MAKQTQPKIKKQAAPEPKPYQALDEIDNKILRMMMEYPEAAVKDIAKAIEQPYEVVLRRTKRPAFKRGLDDIRMSAWDILCKGQLIAARKLIKWVNSDDAKTSLWAAELMLKPLIEAPPVINNNNFFQMTHEVKFGEEGQIYKTVKAAGQDAQAQIDKSAFQKPSKLLGEIVDIE